MNVYRKITSQEPPIYTIIGVCCLLSFFIQFIISPDSYTHDLTGHYDSAWLFTCGKAWMNGMLPYVDFADSKGPLLWLIYGLGYLISHNNYIGVFWLSVINYSFIFLYVFKIANLFLKNDKLSLYVVLIMTSSFFCPWYHGEIRAEDWCQLFIIMSIYRICLLLYTEKGKQPSSIYMSCFVIGLSMAGTLLIKYNVTAMLGCLAIYTLYALIKERKNILLPFLFFMIGFCIISLPFIIYMIVNGLLSPFFNEYFLNTFLTIQSHNSKSIYLKEWLFLTYDTHYIILFIFSFIGATLMATLVSSYKWFFILMFIGFYGIAIHHSEYLHWHYLASCLLFPIWLYIFIIHKTENKRTFSRYTIMTIIFLLLYTITSNLFEWGYLSQNLFFRNSTIRKHFYNVSYYLSQKKNATIIYYNMMDMGFGTPTNSLPGTKYWATQKGATEEMYKSVLKDILSRKSEFIMTYDHDHPIEESTSFLLQAGYKAIYSFKIDKYQYALFSKYSLQNPPKSFHISIWDVLLKKNKFDNNNN